MKTRYNVKSNVPSETRLCNFQSSNVYGSTCPLNKFFLFGTKQENKTKDLTCCVKVREVVWAVLIGCDSGGSIVPA